jgi:hypothetical protein
VFCGLVGATGINRINKMDNKKKLTVFNGVTTILLFPAIIIIFLWWVLGVAFHSPHNIPEGIMIIMTASFLALLTTFAYSTVIVTPIFYLIFLGKKSFLQLLRYVNYYTLYLIISALSVLILMWSLGLVLILVFFIKKGKQIHDKSTWQFFVSMPEYFRNRAKTVFLE